MLHKKKEYLTVISGSYRDRVMYTLRCYKLFGCYIGKELYI